MIDIVPGSSKKMMEYLVDSFEIIVSYSLKEALVHLEKKKDIVAVIIDLAGAKRGGLQLTRSIKKRAPGIPLIIMSDVQDEERGAKMVQAGAADYIIKTSITPHGLVRCLRYTLARTSHETCIYMPNKIRIAVETLGAVSQKIQKRLYDV
ncbi:MAG: response regulator [Candidatus Bathyarchaeota archaeon]